MRGTGKTNALHMGGPCDPAGVGDGVGAFRSGYKRVTPLGSFARCAVRAAARKYVNPLGSLVARAAARCGLMCFNALFNVHSIMQFF